jgi:hypothetical protein
MWKKTFTLAAFGLALGLGACTDPNNPSQRAVGGGLIGGAAGDLRSHSAREPGSDHVMARAIWMGRVAAIACCLLCAACSPDLFGIAMGMKSGQTVDLVTVSPSQVVLQYTHSYSWELAAAGRFADGQCERFDRHAALESTARESVDRSVATFRCE